MERRAFLKQLVKTTAVIGTGVTVTGTIAWYSIEASSAPLTIENLLSQVERLINANDINNSLMTSSQDWNLHQIFTHCAQSIEYSMIGYPLHKSEFFKQTLGSVAFSLFAAKGRMTHNLSEAIPGAPLLKSQPYFLESLKRLQHSLIDFQNHTGELKPRFAYGKLSKPEYALAHIMHFNNHMLQVYSN